MITAIDLAKLRNAEFLQFGATFSGLVVAKDPVSRRVKPSLFSTKLFSMKRLSFKV